MSGQKPKGSSPNGQYQTSHGLSSATHKRELFQRDAIHKQVSSTVSGLSATSSGAMPGQKVVSS